MSKIYSIPLDRGYSSNAYSPEIPVGFWTGKNMIYRNDGALQARYTYKIPSSNKCGPSEGHIIDAFPANGNYIGIASNGKAYYRNMNFGSYWYECSWTGGGTAPQISGVHRGAWGWLNGKPVYTNNYNYPIEFSINGTSFNYLTGGTSNSYKCLRLIEHQNRLLLAGINGCACQIRYSEIDDENSGYTSNYVNVGDEKEAIQGIHNVGGNLVVIKDGALWAKLGAYSELTSDQFQPIFQGIKACQGTSIVARDVLYFGDYGGIFAFSGGTLKNLSFPIQYEWMHRSASPGAPDPRMGYWAGRDWLWVTDGFTYNCPKVYDINRGVWYRFEGISPQCFFSFNDQFQFGMYGSSNCAYVFEYGYPLNAPGVVETSINQELQTPFLDLDSPFTDKYLRKIYLNAAGVDKVEIYIKTSPATPALFPLDPEYTMLSPSDSETLNFDSSKKFREISIKLTGDGDMIVKGIAVEFDERR